MKIIPICVFFFCIIPLKAQQATAKDAFLVKWDNSKNYLIAIAENMPKEHYDFKPTKRQRSFEEQLLHIKDNMDWLSKTYFKSEEYTREKTVDIMTKSDIIDLLTEGFDATFEIVKNTPEENLEEIIEFFAGPKSKLQILNLLQDHVTHHRGQLIVYLNLKNIEPPKYVGW